jgi:pilus assembly protein CpaB
MLDKVNRSWVILVGAVVFGGLAVFAASRYISQTIAVERAKLAPQVEMVDVVVAKGDLERGTHVGPENMAVRPMPREYVPGTAVTPDQFANVEGARLSVDLRGGEVLLRGTLEGADESTFAHKVRDGVRAMTVSVDEVNSISGLLQPGDRIDLFFTARPPRGGYQQAPETTMVLMQNVVLLATGRQVRPSIGDNGQPGATRSYSTVTIEASPRDAQRLILAQKSGTLTAVLRGPEDQAPLQAQVMDSRDLFGAAPVVKRVARSTGPQAEIIVGGKGGKAERELVSLSGLLQSAAANNTRVVPASEVPAGAVPVSALDQKAAEAVRQFVQASGPVPMEVR